jgi:predicted acyltransferase
MTVRTAVRAGADSQVAVLPAGPLPERLLSLDAFRGLTIAAMLLVNHQGSYDEAYPVLQHAEWHGWTPTDLIFPFFLFIVGVSTTFSFGRQLASGSTPGRVLGRAARRALVLILIGLVIAAFPWWRLDLGHLRIPGVLQRIGLAFLAAAPLALWLRMRGQMLVVASLLLGYWALLTLTPVPGVGTGVLEPGRDLGSYIDRAIFGTAHLWPGTWDPEGLLSTIPAVATVMFGALAGQWLRSGRSDAEIIGVLLVAGVAGTVIGLVWDLTFPINKNLWTSSFTVFAAGAAALLLAACYWLADVRRWRRWATGFAVLGVNAILVYSLATLGDKVLWRVSRESRSMRTAVYERFFESWLGPANASLAFAAAYLFFWVVIMAVLYRKGIQVRV